MEVLFHPLKTILFLLVVSGLAFGQAISPDAAKLQFDVASVKPADPPDIAAMVGPGRGRTNPFATAGGPGTNDPARFTAAHASLSSLILRAYGLDFDQLKGPSWLTDSLNSGFAINATMPASTTHEQFCGMLRNLIAGRFHLTFHFEKQPRPGYELTVMPGGPKFKEFVPGPAAPDDGPKNPGLDANGFPILSPSQPTANTWNARTAAWKVSFRNNMAAFALRLAGDIVRLNGTLGGPVPRVVDKTGLTGVYDIRMEIAGMAYPVQGPDGAGTLTPAPSDPTDAGPTVFAAVQQLGLNLTKVADVQVEVMIVDHVDRTPTEN